MEYAEAEVQRLAAEFAAKQAARPVKGNYHAATESSTTERGGTVIVDTFLDGPATVGGRIALVGDTVRYPDGSEAKIISGAGAAAVFRGHPIALVGSALDNGDTINGPVHDGMVIVQLADAEPIPGLFAPGYVADQPKNWPT